MRSLLQEKINELEKALKIPDLTLLEEMRILNENQKKEIAALNKEIAHMKTSSERIRQKLSSSPYLPFIIVRDSETTNIKSHNCLCFYCGFDIKEKENGSISPNDSNKNISSLQNNCNLLNEKEKSMKINPNQQNAAKEKKENSNNFPDVEMVDGNIAADSNQEKLNEDKASNLLNKNLFLNSLNESENFIKKKSSNFSSKKTLNDFNSERNLGLNEENFPNSNTNLNVTLNQIEKQTKKTNRSSSEASSENEPNFLEEEQKQNLESFNRRIYEKYLNLKMEKTVSYQSLIKSKPFQMLLSQIENCVNLIESQKSENSQMKKYISEVHSQISSQEKFYKFEKMKDICLLEEKIEKIQKDFSLSEVEKQKMQMEINRLEDLVKTLKNFDNGQLTSIEEFYKNKFVELIENLKSQAKSFSEKYQIESERTESLEKSNLKLQMELDRFKTALNKYENVEGVENLQFEKFDMREREEMKRQIKTYRDKLSNCEKYYKNTKNELKSEKENGEKLFLEICLNEKINEEMNKTINELKNSLRESNEKIGFLLTEKSKNAEVIRNQNDYIEKIELQIKEISYVEKEFKNLEENYLKEINLKLEIIKKMENFLSFKNQNIDFLYEKIHQVTKNNLSLDNSQQELLKNFESLKSYSTKKICELEKNKSNKGNFPRDYSKMNLKFPDRKTEEEFEIIKLENENYKKKLQCKICCIRDIDSIINKCNHTFCRECIENMVSSRQRICPKCRHKISLKDVSEIWID